MTHVCQLLLLNAARQSVLQICVLVGSVAQIIHPCHLGINVKVQMAEGDCPCSFSELKTVSLTSWCQRCVLTNQQWIISWHCSCPQINKATGHNLFQLIVLFFPPATLLFWLTLTALIALFSEATSAVFREMFLKTYCTKYLRRFRLN